MTAQPRRRRRYAPAALQGLGELGQVTLPISSPTQSPTTWILVAAGAALFAGFFLRPSVDRVRRRASRRLAENSNPSWQTYLLAAGAAGTAYYLAKAAQGAGA